MEGIIINFIRRTPESNISGIAVGLSVALIANGFKKNITHLHFTIDGTGIKQSSEQGTYK
jgi:hypothetical protein